MFCLPHFSNRLLESATRTMTFPPVIFTAVTGTFTVTPNTLPKVFLQSLQWHTIARASSLFVRRIVYLNFWQKQPPFMIMGSVGERLGVDRCGSRALMYVIFGRTNGQGTKYGR
jgi:hypothetical protein